VRARRRLRGLRGGAAPRFAPVLRFPRSASVAVAGTAGLSALVVAGPVAGGVATVYALIGATAWLRHRRTAAATAARSRALDALAGLAADLRAGLAPEPARAAAQPVLDAVPPVRDRVAAAWRVADVTGAPLADLLDRLEVDLRSLERVRLTAAAHAAGTRATAGLLAVLPVAGIALGYGMGADPLRVLLHTPVGAACAGAAVLLQLAGLAWTNRLARVTSA
jgi:tight adherence protein B